MFYWAVTFTIGIPVIICLILVWIGYTRINEFRAHQKDIGLAAIELVVEDVQHIIQNNQRLVKIFAEYYQDKINELTNTPENHRLHAFFEERLRSFFPHMFTYTVTNNKGTPYMDDFDLTIGPVCLADIRELAVNKAYKTRVHPNPYVYHYDIMAPWKTATNNGIFFVSFKPDSIARRLTAASPPGHELILIIKEREYLIEINETGARNTLSREDYRMTKAERGKILNLRKINTTAWHVADLHHDTLFQEFNNTIYATYGSMILIFIIVSSIITYLLFHFEKKRITAQQTQKEMLSLFSHELRSPIIAISSAMNLLKDGIQDIPQDRLKRIIDLSSENTDTMGRIVDDILDVYRLELGKMQFQFAHTDIVALCQKAIDMNQSYAESFNVGLVFEPQEKELMAYADATRLIQAITNLITNAIKYSPEHDVVTISVSKEKHFSVISVIDNGAGIPESFKSQIFTKFAQSKNPSRKTIASSGLGLAIVKHIVESHKGNVSFISNEGIGSTFHIHLPLSHSIT